MPLAVSGVVAAGGFVARLFVALCSAAERTGSRARTAINSVLIQLLNIPLSRRLLKPAGQSAMTPLAIGSLRQGLEASADARAGLCGCIRVYVVKRLLDGTVQVLVWNLE